MMSTDSRPVLRIINNTLLILCNTINIVLIIMSTDSRPVLRIINNTLLILCNTINIVPGIDNNDEYIRIQGQYYGLLIIHC